MVLETTITVEGRPVKDYIDFYSCWSNVSALSSTMSYKAMESHLESTILFNIKFCSKVSDLDDVKYKDKLFVEFRSKKYRIYLVDMKQYNHQDVTLKGTEVE